MVPIKQEIHSTWIEQMEMKVEEQTIEMDFQIAAKGGANRVYFCKKNGNLYTPWIS